MRHQAKIRSLACVCVHLYLCVEGTEEEVEDSGLVRDFAARSGVLPLIVTGASSQHQVTQLLRRSRTASLTR